MAITIAISNQKGGVGKTTTSNAIASYLISIGKKVLMLDAAPQRNTTDWYRAVEKGQATLYDLMNDECDVFEAIQSTETGDIIACDALLKRSDRRFIDTGYEYIIKDALKPIQKDYDYIIVDTDPDTGALVINALTAADYAIIPVEPDASSIQGLSEFLDTIEKIKKHTNPTLKIAGVLITLCDERTNFEKSIVNSLVKLQNKTGVKVFKSKIRKTVLVKEARGKRVALFKYAPECTAAQDYKKFVNELMEDMKNG